MEIGALRRHLGDVFGEVVYAGDEEAAAQTIDLAIDADPEIAALFATLPEL